MVWKKSKNKDVKYNKTSLENFSTDAKNGPANETVLNSTIVAPGMALEIRL